MQELKFEQVEYVSGGLNLYEDPRGTTFGDNNKSDDSEGGFWSSLGQGIGSAIKSIGSGFENITGAVKDGTGAIKVWTDTNNIERMCASGAVETAKTDAMEVTCKTD